MHTEFNLATWLRIVNIIEFSTINFITRSKISKIAITLLVWSIIQRRQLLFAHYPHQYKSSTGALHTHRDKNFTHPLCSLPGVSKLFRNLASITMFVSRTEKVIVFCKKKKEKETDL